MRLRPSVFVSAAFPLLVSASSAPSAAAVLPAISAVSASPAPSAAAVLLAVSAYLAPLGRAAARAPVLAPTVAGGSVAPVSPLTTHQRPAQEGLAYLRTARREARPTGQVVPP